MTTPKLSPTGALSISADIDGVDAVASEMERKWGVGRLRLLVGFDLRARFDRQRAKFNSAVWSFDQGETRKHAEAMVRAWHALDAAAEAAGHKPLSPQVWEVGMADGSVVAICCTSEDAHAVIADGRHVTVYTLDEIAHLIEGFPMLAKAKAEFPGAKVEAARTRDDQLNDAFEDVL